MNRSTLFLFFLFLAVIVPKLLADDAADDKIEPGVCKGKVTNSEGKPLVGAVINLENQMFISQADIRIKKDGNYRRELTLGSWRPRGTYTAEYNGETYKMDLLPDNPDEFDGKTGAVVNFTLKLSGKKPDPMVGYFGSPVIVYNNPGDFDVDLLSVVLTVTPDGPLVDGSAGKEITRQVKPTGDGPGLVDIPIGRYKISAKTKAGQPLLTRVRTAGTYDKVITADFIHNRYLESLHLIELEIKSP